MEIIGDLRSIHSSVISSKHVLRISHNHGLTSSFKSCLWFFINVTWEWRMSRDVVSDWNEMEKREKYVTIRSNQYREDTNLILYVECRRKTTLKFSFPWFLKILSKSSFHISYNENEIFLPGPVLFPPGPPPNNEDTSGVIVGASGYGFVPPNQGKSSLGFWGGMLEARSGVAPSICS